MEAVAVAPRHPADDHHLRHRHLLHRAPPLRRGAPPRRLRAPPLRREEVHPDAGAPPRHPAEDGLK